MNDKNSNSFMQNLKSVLAALLGIQSDKNRRRDFHKGDPAQFMLIGIITVIIMVLVLAFVVQQVISSAG